MNAGSGCEAPVTSGICFGNKTTRILRITLREMISVDAEGSDIQRLCRITMLCESEKRSLGRN